MLCLLIELTAVQDDQEPSHSYSECTLLVQRRMATYYVSSYYQVCQRHFPTTPKLTDQQLAAFEKFDALASRPDIAMNWVLQPGDIQFLQNHLVIHNRSAFKDHEVEPTLNYEA